MASTGHSGTHKLQSIHSSGSMTSIFGPSRKQSTGQTSTQSVYLQRIQDSVTTWVIVVPRAGETLYFIGFDTAFPKRGLAASVVCAWSTNQHGPRGLVARRVHKHQGTQRTGLRIRQRRQRLLQAQLHVADAIGLEV